MSIVEQARRRGGPTASVLQVVVATLASIVIWLSAQMAGLTAWIDTLGSPGGWNAQRVDELGQPFTGWEEVWHRYGPLLWAAYALALLFGAYLMWRTVLTRPGRRGWWSVLAMLAASSVFWAMNLDRFSL